MEIETFYSDLKAKFLKIIDDNKIETDKIIIKVNGLSTKQAIGITKRKDYPILTGKEVMIDAEFNGYHGQAFTCTPACFNGSLTDILSYDISHDSYALGLTIASINAVMSYLNLTDRTIHCKNKEPEICGEKSLEFLGHYPDNTKIVMAGYQPALLSSISKRFTLTVLELNQDLIGKEINNCKIISANNDINEILDWADVILCTGSAICNYSILPYIKRKDKVWFYGTSIAGAAALYGLNRLCYSPQT